VSKVPFECRAVADNRGCQRVVSCPAGTRVIGAVAAADLEFGPVTLAAVERVPVNTVRVVRASDWTAAGRCFVHETTLSSGEKAISGAFGSSSVRIGCFEHDANGGDCHIRGALYCR
jgi:hypothetical protein